MIDTVLLLTIPQIYVELFPEWGLTIFPPKNNNDYIHNKTQFSRLLTQLLIWIGYSIVGFKINPVGMIITWISVSVSMILDLMQMYEYSYIGFICAMGGIGIILISCLPIQHTFLIVMYYSWYVSSSLQIVMKRYHGDNETISKFLLCMSNLCILSVVIGNNGILDKKPYMNMITKIIYLLTWLVIFGKYFIELRIHYYSNFF